jgi:hypothetical protein
LKLLSEDKLLSAPISKGVLLEQIPLKQGLKRTTSSARGAFKFPEGLLLEQIPLKQGLKLYWDLFIFVSLFIFLSRFH